MSLDMILEQNIGRMAMFVLENHGCSISLQHVIINVYTNDEEIDVELDDGSEIIIRDFKEMETDGFGHYFLPNNINIFLMEVA